MSTIDSRVFYLAGYIEHWKDAAAISIHHGAPRRYQQLCAGKLKIFPGSEFEGNYLNRIKLPYKSTSLITNCISIAPSPHQPNTSPPPLQKTITFVQEQDVYCLLLSVLCFCSSFPLLCDFAQRWCKTGIEAFGKRSYNSKLVFSLDQNTLKFRVVARTPSKDCC